MATPRFKATAFAPLMIGAAYAATKSLAKGEGWGGLYWQSPVVFSFLAGLLLALSLRPLLVRIPWTRATAFALGLGVLLGVGPLGGRAASWVTTGLGLLPEPRYWVSAPLPEILGLWVVAGLLAWFYRPRGGTLGWEDLRQRWRYHPRQVWCLRMGLLLLALIGISAVAGAVGVWVGQGPLLQPLDPANPWTHWFAQTAGATPGGSESLATETHGASGGVHGLLGLCVVEALRGVVLIASLMPLVLVIRGSRAELSFLFALLVFVLGAFAPLMEAQPYPSALWLTARVLLAGVTAAASGMSFAWTVGQLRGQNRGPNRG